MLWIVLGPGAGTLWWILGIPVVYGIHGFIGSWWIHVVDPVGSIWLLLVDPGGESWWIPVVNQ